MSGVAGWIFGGVMAFFAVYLILAALVVHRAYKERFEKAGLPWKWWDIW